MNGRIDNEILNEILMQVNKPARYCGGEYGSETMSGGEVKFALAFPDIYEVGMSHLGMKILYSLLNKLDYVDCERCFAPMQDMAAQLRAHNLKLYSLETFTPLNKFDFVGFSLQYEMCLTTVLYMLELSGIPLTSKERTEEDPLVMAGGCVCLNPEPFCDIFDLMVLGEAEEVLPYLTDLYRNCETREDFLIKAAKVDGVYVPKFYEVEYNGAQITRKTDLQYCELLEMILQYLTRKRFIIKLLDSNRVFLEEGKNCLNILHTMSSIQLTLQKTRLKDAY